jgi:hypothetical protein
MGPLKTKPILFDELLIRVEQPLVPGQKYVVEVGGLKSVSGVIGHPVLGFEVPKAPPKDSTKADSTKTDSTKAAGAKADTTRRRARPASTKADTAKADTAKADTAKADTAKVDTTARRARPDSTRRPPPTKDPSKPPRLSALGSRRDALLIDG